MGWYSNADFVNIQTLDGYLARYAEILADFQAQNTPAACMRAWESVEIELFTEFGERRYTTYASFRAASAQARRRKKINKVRITTILLTP